MRRLQRYIFAQIFKAVAFSTITIVLVGCSLYSQRYLADIIEHGIPLAAFGELVLFMVPTLVVLVMPITLAGGMIFIYGKLSEDSELTVARACGMSQMSLLVPAIAVAVLAALISYAMALYVIPQSIERFRDIRDTVRHTRVDTLLRDQTFNTVSPGLTIYFATREADGLLRNILIHDQRNLQRVATVIAEHAVLDQDQDLLEVRLIDGNLQRFRPTTRELTTVYFDTYTFEVDLSSVLSSGDPQDPSVEELAIGALLFPPDEVAPGSDEYRRRLAEGHQRLTSPLMCITVALIAGASLFGGQYRRHGHRLRLAAIGLVVSILLLAYHATVVAAGTTTLLIPALYALVIVPGLLACLAIWRGDHGYGATPPASPLPAGASTG